MRSVLVAYLILAFRHIVKAYLCHYRDNLFDWCRSIAVDDRRFKNFQLILKPPLLKKIRQVDRTEHL